jgi:ABC-type multidrug transport system ATPase subunit
MQRINDMLTINNLNKKYADGTHALKNVSLHFPTGMIGLLGPNGAGKSSLMRTLACLQTPDDGQMNLNGIDLRKSPDELRKILGYLPQYFGVYPHMSCQALLEHMAILKGVDKATTAKQIASLLELTNLTDVAHKKVATFSGGMRQRFGIAQALLGDPKIIIMDEPTSGLDPVERERLHRLLVAISKKKLVILSTHIVEDIENLCHHVALMIKGEVIDSADVKTLISPLEDCIWQTHIEPDDDTDIKVLSKSYRFGEPSLRLYSKSKPTVDAVLVEASLQDRYFFELLAKEQS